VGDAEAGLAGEIEGARVDVCGDGAHEGVEDAADGAGLAWAVVVLIEEGDAAVGLEDADCLLEGAEGVGDDGDDEVEDDDVECGVGELEVLRVHGLETDVEAGGLEAGLMDHAGAEVDGVDFDTWGEEGDVEPGAAAVDEDAVAGLDLGEGEGALALRCESDEAIVVGGDEFPAEFGPPHERD